MQTLILRPLGGDPLTSKVRNPRATIGAAAAKAASHSGLGGQFRIFENRHPGGEIPPNTPVNDLPRNTEFLLVPDLTPADPA